MCHVFAGQDPDTYRFVTRSIRINGHSTSVRLEARFWDILETMAASQKLTVPQFVSELYEEVLELQGEISNFASLLRCACLLFLTDERFPATARLPVTLAVEESVAV
ncbi:ribbon-helix-helix domain-containing protein [Pelagibius litoralis]|uniref:Ribbon-helix-helix domain-containing protein n=1 Tax=Pelagibius litoralis TaxID=374515 RepID=A0A967EWU2_9PROT|nr:ribbon-helix-helix domain-containing protein [Pelagibius litoralis]NIA68373.1 ribbon-helix-helix domain-containing protein [Pelagibius litoralis]